jgi:hypothetical protein
MSRLVKYAAVGCIALLYVVFTGAVLGGMLA